MTPTRPRKIIVVTGLDLWMLTDGKQALGTGNQSLFNTLLGYAHAGFDVHMLTTSTLHCEVPPIHDKVIVHREPIASYELYLRAKKVLSPFGRSRQVKYESSVDPRNMLSRVASENLWRYSAVFRAVMGRRAIRLANRVGGVAFVYGHEILGARAGEYAAKRLTVPLVTRFQGTELGQFVDDAESLLACKAHVAALRANADLVIMANDGTRGDEVLERLGVPKAKCRFLMNGVVKEDVYRPAVDDAAIRHKLAIGVDEAFLLYCGRMFYWKRVDRLLEVAASLMHSSVRFKLVVIVMDRRWRR